MSSCFDTKTRSIECVSELAFEPVIKTTKQDLLVIAPAAVYRNHDLTLADKSEALWFVKTLAAQVKRSIVPGWLDTLEEIKIEFFSGNGARYLRCPGLDATTVWSEHRNARVARAHHDVVVLSTNLRLCKVGKTSIRLGASGSDHAACSEMLWLPRCADSALRMSGGA